MIPIFIIVKDRLSVLIKSIESYEKLGDVGIILLDNNSTYPPLLEYLRTCPYQVITNPNPTNDFNDISEWVSDCIEDWYDTYESPFYIVTDPDIELENPITMLQYYKDIMTYYPYLICVGPMLRIDDIPDCFKFKKDMQESHLKQFWDNTHKTYLFEEVKVQQAAIDTTFAMYRQGFVFKRLNHGIRTHEPYIARHLDWYMDTDNLTEEQQYYKEHASMVSTMSEHLKRGSMKGW